LSFYYFLYFFVFSYGKFFSIAIDIQARREQTNSSHKHLTLSFLTFFFEEMKIINQASNFEEMKIINQASKFEEVKNQCYKAQNQKIT
jgi:hypothetical protein